MHPHPFDSDTFSMLKEEATYRFSICKHNSLARLSVRTPASFLSPSLLSDKWGLT